MLEEKITPHTPSRVQQPPQPSLLGYLTKKEDIPKTSKRMITAPGKRWGHTALEHKGFLYLFGGNTSTSYSYAAQAIFKLDLFKWNVVDWEKIVPGTGEIPMPRDSHTCVVVKDV